MTRDDSLTINVRLKSAQLASLDRWIDGLSGANFRVRKPSVGLSTSGSAMLPPRACSAMSLAPRPQLWPARSWISSRIPRRQKKSNRSASGG